MTRAAQFPSGQMGCFLISVPLQDFGKWRKKENQQQAPRTLCYTQLLARRASGGPHTQRPQHVTRNSPRVATRPRRHGHLTQCPPQEEGPSFQTPPCVAGTRPASPALCTTLSSGPHRRHQSLGAKSVPSAPPGLTNITSRAADEGQSEPGPGGWGSVALTKLPQAHFSCQVPGRAVCVPDPATGTTARRGLPCL